MCTERKTGSWLPIVKNVVDSVYDYLAPHPEGITMSASDYGHRGGRVCAELVKRGIIEKQGLGYKKGWRYRWIATMGPTNVLYGSIAQKLYDEDRMYKDVHRKKKAAEKSKNVVVDTPSTEQPLPEAKREYVSDLKGFSAQELWDELKGRGYFIEGERLAITQTAYLD